ncbi:hypothetical protein A9Q99_25205 [Gammaproteobacteria bacterium 45_16_T64]|nr:hypothetical protein A9Q99_25205 [Gammaproteobacteria bacterium 45_16_T64]
MATSSTRPINQLLDILGKKWVLRILWELHTEPCTFRELQGRCGDISPTMINNRVKDLCAGNLVEKTPDQGYRLSTFGKELVDVFMPLNDFATRWSDSNR